MRPDRRDPSRDPAHLQDMLNAAIAVKSFITNRTRSEYANDLMLRSAVERQIEVIGEAACNVSKETQAKHAEIPWRAIQAQRHRLVHEYGEVNDDLIWTVATVHVPPLIEQLRQILPNDV